MKNIIRTEIPKMGDMPAHFADGVTE